MALMSAGPFTETTEEAFARLLRHGDSAYRLAASVLGSTSSAEDVVQAAYLEAVDAELYLPFTLPAQDFWRTSRLGKAGRGDCTNFEPSPAIIVPYMEMFFKKSA